MAVALLGGGLAILLTAFVAYGQAFTQHSQNRGFLGWLASQAIDTAKAAIWITEQVVPLTSYILHELGHTFNVAYSTAARWVGGLENYVQMTGAAAVNLGLALNDWTKWMVYHYVPSLVHGVTAPVTKVIHGATVRIVKIERTIVKVPSLTRAQVKALVAVAIPGIVAKELPYFEWLKQHLKALERAIAGTLPHPTLDLAGIRARLKKLEKVSATSLVAGTVALALARLGATWIRCNNWKRIGRAGCQMSPNAITQLLGLAAGLAVIESNLSIVTLAEEMLKVEEFMIGTLKATFSETRDIAA